MNDLSSVRQRSAPISLALLAGIALMGMMVFVIGVGGGVLLDRSGLIPGPATRQPAGLAHTFDPFWETWNLVEEHYVDRSSIQPNRMTQGAILGMLESLGDIGHTTYLTAEDLKRLDSSLKGELEGIGARMTVRERKPTVVQTLPNSPARATGLKAGDILLEVDGEAVLNLPLQQIVEKVRGPAGTKVRMRILRDGKPMDFEVPRAKVEVPDIDWHMLPGTQIAHLAIQDFGRHADDQLKTAIKEAHKAGAKGLILDVRANPGGLKEQAVAVTSEFLKGGNVFIEQDSKGHQKAVPVQEDGVATDLPAVVLIDEGTASSAEIFAGALQDHKRGQLVGTKTFGTGTVLQPFKLSDGSAVLLAVSQWLTPDGRQIWHKGISPDVEIALPKGNAMLLPDLESDLSAEEFAKTGDKQLLKALEVIKGEIH